jgi:hypothetical protein
MENNNEQSKLTLDSLIGDNTSRAVFEDVIRQLLPQQVKLVELVKEGAEEKLQECLLYPAIMAPEPATFNTGALAAMWGSSDNNELTETLMRICLDMGVIAPSQTEGRFMISQNMKDKLEFILKQYP